MTTDALEGGFADPALDSARAFRAVMTAMARPGTIHRLDGATPPAPLSPAAGAVLLTLCDADTPVHLAGATDCPAVRQWIAFHIGAPISGAADCTFALGRWEDLDHDRYPLGTPEYPDRSATLIVETDKLMAEGARLSGPGIRDTATLSLNESDLYSRNRTLFPLGLDLILTCGAQVAAVPRTTRVQFPATEDR